MAENLKKLRRRIRSVSSTRKITRTMEMISVAKLRRIQNAMEAARPYAVKIQQLIAHLSHSAAAAELPLFCCRDTGRVTVVVVASDRGLCGGYNAAVLRTAEEFIAHNGGRGAVDVFAVGKRARDFMNKMGHPVIGAEIAWSGRVSAERSNAIANQMVERFLKRETNRVILVYNSYVSSSTYRPVATQFLPLTTGELGTGAEGAPDGGARRRDTVYNEELDYIFEPSAPRVFDELLPRYVRTKVYAALLEAMTTEHIARRIAMNNATENAGEMIKSLSLRANKARQAAITKEILEIVGGAEALKG